MQWYHILFIILVMVFTISSYSCLRISSRMSRFEEQKYREKECEESTNKGDE